MDQVAPGIYTIDGLKTGRSYLIDDHDGLTLVDTSSPGAATRILDAIASIGRAPDDLRTIIATHYHYDHTGNVAALVESTGAKLYVHAIEAPYIDGREKWMLLKGLGPLAGGQRDRQYALGVDRELSTGETLPIAGGLEVVHAPGHTPGHIALYARDRRVLFSGDAFMNVAGLHLPMYVSTHDREKARRSIAKLSKLDFDIALPGHGRPIIGRANEKLADWSRRWL